MAQLKADTDMKAPVRGRLTFADLTRTAAFFAPWEPDPWGRLRPPFSRELMRLSLELSSTAYDLRIGDWMRAGWTDFNFQVDNKLRGGVAQAQLSEPKQFLYNKWAVYRARANARQLNPVSQVFSAMRQREGSDTGKAVVMIKAAEEGRYVVAMGFRGTGTRFYDWFSNFRFSSENGIHQGFLQLARQFDENAERISFPETAAELGLPRLTLADILREASRQDSRFRLWLCGHSQGAAVLQVLAHLWTRESGVLPQNMVGYGFASPMVMMGTAVPDPAAYPLYHVLNSDDYVTRSGAQVHLGMCLVYPADGQVRRAAYGWRETEDAAKARETVRDLTRDMIDMPSLIEHGMAYLQLLAAMPAQEMLGGLHFLPLRILPLKQVMTVTGASQDSLLRYVRRRVEKAYLTITGHGLDQRYLDRLQAEMADGVRAIGTAEFSRAMGEMLYWPHVLKAGQGKAFSAYQYIAMRGAGALAPTIWQSGTPPFRLWREMVLPAGPAPAAGETAPEGALYNRRRTPTERRPLGRRMAGRKARR